MLVIGFRVVAVLLWIEGVLFPCCAKVCFVVLVLCILLSGPSKLGVVFLAFVVCSLGV